MSRKLSLVCRAKIYLWDFISFKSAMTDFLSFSERVLKVSATKRVSAGICGVFSVSPVTRYSTETPRARAIFTELVAFGSTGFDSDMDLWLVISFMQGLIENGKSK